MINLKNMQRIFCVAFSFLSFAGDQCLGCFNVIGNDKLRHILDNHHGFAKTCFFCDETPSPSNMNTQETHSIMINFGNHLKEKHTDLLLGLYLHFFSKEPLWTSLKKWNITHYYYRLNAQSLYAKECKCSLCGQTIRALGAPYHFVKEIWGKDSTCSVCAVPFTTTKHKSFITFDALKAIKHARTCCFDLFNESFKQAFPGLTLRHENNCLVLAEEEYSLDLSTVPAVQDNNIPAFVVPQKIDSYSCKKCFETFFTIADIFNHLVNESIAQHRDRCTYCSFKITQEDFQAHLLTYHVKNLYNETQKIELFFDQNMQ